MALPSAKPAAGADPLDKSLSLEATPLATEYGYTYEAAVDAKTEWDTKVSSAFAAYDITDVFNELESSQNKSDYRELIYRQSVYNIIGSNLTNLFVELTDKDSAVWYTQQARKYLHYFVKLIQNKIERNPGAFLSQSIPFDDIIRPNKEIAKDIVMLPGKFMNPVTRTRFTKDEYDRHIELLDSIRNTVNNDIYEEGAELYATYVIGTGRNFPNK
jgi:hypothetical protein